jgi:hypothetical protein
MLDALYTLSHLRFMARYLVNHRDNFTLTSYNGIDGGVILKWILKEEGVRVGTGFIWLKIGSSGELL